MSDAPTILIFGEQASGKTQVINIIAEALKANGIAFVANDAADCFGFNGTEAATVKGVVTIATMRRPIVS